MWDFGSFLEFFKQVELPKMELSVLWTKELSDYLVFAEKAQWSNVGSLIQHLLNKSYTQHCVDSGRIKEIGGTWASQKRRDAMDTVMKAK